MNYDIDFDRHKRIGFPEVVFGASKDVETLKNIISKMYDKHQKVLITKLQEEKYEELKSLFPNSFYDEVSGVWQVGTIKKSRKKNPEVVILSGGSSDEFVVNEAYYTLLYLGISAKKLIDVGVSGVHRLMDKTDQIKKAKVLIVCAGFEGALPTVVSGLFPQPIIGVPVSVGYGVAEGGFTALNSMLASCGNGLAVTNIDNGYGAAISAFRILQLMAKK